MIIAKMLAVFVGAYLLGGIVTASLIWREVRRRPRAGIPTRFTVRAFLQLLPAILFCWPFPPQWFR